MMRSADIVNRQAFHEYEVLEEFEAGIVLVGTEVKSLRMGRANIKDAHARFVGDELFLFGLNISPYPPAALFNHEPLRPRKLLLHRRELHRLLGVLRERGLTLVPLRLYFHGRRAKCRLALAKGKKLYDKRQALKEKDIARESHRAIKEERGR
jgi:SsrA-binding protein